MDNRLNMLKKIQIVVSKISILLSFYWMFILYIPYLYTYNKLNLIYHPLYLDPSAIMGGDLYFILLDAFIYYFPIMLLLILLNVIINRIIDRKFKMKKVYYYILVNIFVFILNIKFDVFHAIEWFID